MLFFMVLDHLKILLSQSEKKKKIEHLETT